MTMIEATLISICVTILVIAYILMHINTSLTEIRDELRKFRTAKIAKEE